MGAEGKEGKEREGRGDEGKGAFLQIKIYHYTPLDILLHNGR